MSDHLVLIRTFHDLFEADDAQAELYAAGIHSLLVSDDTVAPPAPADQLVGLAVHRRDADMAAQLLNHTPRPAS